MSACFKGRQLRSIKRLRAEMREHGLKSAFKRGGWRLFAIVFVAYLVRDLLLYVVLPVMVYLGFKS
jgi:hypothetical protein